MNLQTLRRFASDIGELNPGLAGVMTGVFISQPSPRGGGEELPGRRSRYAKSRTSRMSGCPYIASSLPRGSATNQNIGYSVATFGGMFIFTRG